MGILRETVWAQLQKHTSVARRGSLVVALLASLFVPFFFIFDRDTVIEEHGFSQSMGITSVKDKELQPLLDYLSKRIANTCELPTDSDDGTVTSDRMALCLTRLLSLSDVPDTRSGDHPVPDQFTDRWNTGNRPLIFRQAFEEFNSEVQSENIIAIVPASRGDKRDGLFLNFSTDWWAPQSDARVAAVGIALVWQLTHNINWLSRDVIVLFSNKRLPFAAGTRAFVRAYYLGGVSKSSAQYDIKNAQWQWNLDARKLRRGVLIAGIVVEYDDQSPNTLLLDVEGVDGLLPNQDVVNSFSEEARVQGITVATRPVWTSILRHALNTGGRAAHTPMVERTIPVFTARGLRSPDVRTGPFPSIRLLKTLEKSIRGQSNVLQTLHHSFNLYYFTSPTSHITNGVYLYIIPLMLLPVIVRVVFSSAVALDIPKVVLGFSVISSIAVVGSLPSYLLATRVAFSASDNPLSQTAQRFCGSTFSLPSQWSAPECGPLYEGALPIYTHRVGMWVVALIVGYAACGCAVVFLGRRLHRSTTKATTGTPSELWEFVSLALRITVTFFLLFLSFLNWSLGVLLALVLWVPCAVAEPIRLIGPQPKMRKLSTNIMITVWIAVLLAARSLQNTDTSHSWLQSNAAAINTVGMAFGKNDVHRSVLHNTQFLWDYKYANRTADFELCDAEQIHYLVENYKHGEVFIPKQLGVVGSALWRLGWSYARLLNRSVVLPIYTLVQTSVCVGDWLAFTVWFAILPFVYTTIIIMFVLPVTTVDALDEFEDL
eukprot:Lankesteria_metandrocarpae@DN3275_c0_g1_i1.p1